MKAITAPEMMDFEPFRGAVERWFSLRGTQGLPAFAQWDLEQDPLKDYRMIARVQADPLWVQYETVGAELENLYGKPITGQNLDTLYNDWFRKIAYRGYRFTLEHGVPALEKRMISTIVRQIGYIKIHLPMGNAHGVDHVVTYLLPSGGVFKRRMDWEAMVKATPWL